MTSEILAVYKTGKWVTRVWVAGSLAVGVVALFTADRFVGLATTAVIAAIVVPALVNSERTAVQITPTGVTVVGLRTRSYPWSEIGGTDLKHLLGRYMNVWTVRLDITDSAGKASHVILLGTYRNEMAEAETIRSQIEAFRTRFRPSEFSDSDDAPSGHP